MWRIEDKLIFKDSIDHQNFSEKLEKILIESSTMMLSMIRQLTVALARAIICCMAAG